MVWVVSQDPMVTKEPSKIPRVLDSSPGPSLYHWLEIYGGKSLWECSEVHSRKEPQNQVMTTLMGKADNYLKHIKTRQGKLMHAEEIHANSCKLMSVSTSRQTSAHSSDQAHLLGAPP